MAEQTQSVAVAYRPGAGDPKTTTAFGRTFRAGEFVEVEAWQAAKARGNPTFEVKGESTFGDDQRKEADQPPEPQPEVSFEDNVERETAAEFGISDPMFAERLRRAREHNAELSGIARIEAEAGAAEQRAAVAAADDDDDGDDARPRRGRPPKAR